MIRYGLVVVTCFTRLHHECMRRRGPVHCDFGAGPGVEENDTMSRALPPCAGVTHTMAHMRDTDPLTPVGRACWACANGCSYDLFPWAENQMTKPTPSSSTLTAKHPIPELLSPVGSPHNQPSLSFSSSSSSLLFLPRSTGRSAAKARPSSARPSSTTWPLFSSSPKPYRTSMPIPIPQPAGAAANSRRRTSAKIAQEGTGAPAWHSCLSLFLFFSFQYLREERE
jgi:hypothetical protein